MSAQILTIDQISINGTASSKDDAIREAHAILHQAGAVTDAYLTAMFDREGSVSTYMGNLLAIPHGTNESKDAILNSALSFVRYAEPIDWDGNPVRFVVGVAGKGNEHLEILGSIAVIFSEEEPVEALIAATSAEEILELLAEVNA